MSRKSVIILVLIALSVTLAFAQMPASSVEEEEEEEEMFTLPEGRGGLMGWGMMGRMRRSMMEGMPFSMGRMRVHGMPGFFAMIQEELNLSDEQVNALEQIRFQALKENIQRNAAIEVAEVELRELLAANSVDMAKVEAKVREIEKLRADKRIMDIQLHEKARNLLTAEQQKKLRALEGRMMRRMGARMQQGMMPGKGEPCQG